MAKKDLEFGKRLEQFINKAKLNNKKVADAIGVSPAAIGTYINEGRIPEAPILLRLSRLFNKPMEELLAGERKPPMVTEEKAVEDFVYVPVVRGEISAGGGLVSDNTVELRISFRKDWIQRHGDPKNMSLIRVSGDSMEPTLWSGDILLVDHSRNYIDPQGGIYAIVINDTIMIKRVQIIYPAKKIRIISDNPKYEPLEADPDNIIINGKVIWFGREIER